MPKRTVIIVLSTITTALFLGIGVCLAVKARISEPATSINHFSDYRDSLQPRANKSTEIANYSITVSDRDLPCASANYSIVTAVDSPRIASPISGFVGRSLGGGKISTKSTKVEGIVAELASNIHEVNMKYKFGEVSAEARSAEIDSLVGEADNKLSDLKLDLWNQEIERVKNEHNKTIKNGRPEKCFDEYMIDKLTLQEYTNLDAIKDYGL